LQTILKTSGSRLIEIKISHHFFNFTFCFYREFWWPGFPILVYFKETQTKPEGQIHFFPLIFNGKQVYDVMVERCGTSENSGPNE